MYCKKCGTELKDGTAFCDKCGAPQFEANNQPSGQSYVQPYYNSAPAGSTKGKSIGGMVCGILGIVCCWIPTVQIFTTILALIGVILSGVALKAKPVGSDKGMAVAGLVCGIIGLAIGAIGILCVVCLTSTAATGLGLYSGVLR